MKKLKLFSLALVALFATSAWADDVVTLKGATTKDDKSTALTPTISTTNAKITTGTCASTCSTSGYLISTADDKRVILGETTYYVGQPYQSGSKKYWKDAGANFYGTFTVPSGHTYTIKRVSHALAAVSSSNFTATITVKDATTTKYTSGSLSVASKSSGATITSTVINLAEANWVVLSSGTYTINVTPANTADASTGKYFGIAEVALTGDLQSTTPTLTGAWKIGDDTVTSANIMQGVDASIPSFSVGATSGTPTGSDYNVAYSLKEGSAAGIFTYGANTGISAISTENAGSATILATLTTTNAENYLTPATNTFEYTVTVSAAAAPSFTSVTPSATDVVRGKESNIVAVVAGTPTPTIQWYSNTTASNEGGEAIDGATDLTLNLANATVGTFYYYAVATNTTSQVNNVASAVQTITVSPKAPTLPASANFLDSKSVTIAKAEGEAEEAVIKYSVDNGENWIAYNEALELDATTTVKAKVEQSGISSAVAEATYTKYSKSDLVSINGNTTWTFNYSGAPTITLTAETTPSVSSDEYYTYSDIAILNSADISGFSGSSTIAFRGQYPLRGGNGCQNGWLKFNTTVAGSIEVEFSNTGGSNKNRYVKVNSAKGKTEADGTTKRTETFNVSAGDVIITGVNGTSGAEGTGTDAAIRVYSIVFTKDTGTALDNTSEEVKAIKVLRDGQLFIEKNGHVYNVFGTCIK